MSSAVLREIIRANGLTHCFHVELHCQLHGYIRIAVKHPAPGHRSRCPICDALCECTLQGEGGTRRPLPFWEKMRSGSFAEALAGFWTSHKAQNRVNI